MKNSILQKIAGENYFCQLNSELFSQQRQPFQLICCNEIICEQCLTQYEQFQTCPLCQGQLNRSNNLVRDNQELNISLLKDLNNKEFKCLNYNDCGWEGLIKEMKQHFMKQCKIKCQNYENCHFDGFLQVCLEHQQNCIYKPEKLMSTLNINRQIQLVYDESEQSNLEMLQNNSSINFLEPNNCFICQQIIEDHLFLKHFNDAHKISSNDIRNAIEYNYRNQTKDHTQPPHISEKLFSNEISDREIQNLKDDTLKMIQKDINQDDISNLFKNLSKDLQQNQRAFYILYFLSLYCLLRILIISFDINYLQLNIQDSNMFKAMLAFIIIQIFITVKLQNKFIIFKIFNSIFFSIKTINIYISISNFFYYIANLKNGTVFVLRISLVIGIVDALVGLIYDMPIIILMIINQNIIPESSLVFPINIIIHIIQIVACWIITISSFFCDIITGTDPTGNVMFSSLLQYQLIINFNLVLIDLYYCLVFKSDDQKIRFLVIILVAYFVNFLYQIYYMKFTSNHNARQLKSQTIQFINFIQLDLFQFIIWDLSIIIVDQIFEDNNLRKEFSLFTLTYVHIFQIFFSLVVRSFIFIYFIYLFPQYLQTQVFRMNQQFNKNQGQLDYNQQINIELK